MPSPAEILHGRNLTTRAQAEIDIKAIRSVLQERQLKMMLDHDTSRRALGRVVCSQMGCQSGGVCPCREIKYNTWRKVTRGCLFQERYNGTYRPVVDS